MRNSSWRLIWAVAAVSLAPVAAVAQTPPPSAAAPPPTSPAASSPAPSVAAPPLSVAPAAATGCAVLSGLVGDSGGVQTAAERSTDGRFFAVASAIMRLTATVTVPADTTVTLAIDGAAPVAVGTGGTATIPVAKAAFHHVIRLATTGVPGSACAASAYHLFAIDGFPARPVFDSSAAVRFGDATTARQLSLAFAPSSGDDLVVDATARLGLASQYHAQLSQRFDTAQAVPGRVALRVLDDAGRDLVGLGDGVGFKNTCASLPFLAGSTANVNAALAADAPGITYVGAELRCDPVPSIVVRSSFALPLLSAQPFPVAITVDDQGGAPALSFTRLQPVDVTSGVSLVPISGTRTSADWVLGATLRFSTIGLGTQAPVLLSVKQRRLVFEPPSPDQAVAIAFDDGKLVLAVRRLECAPALLTTMSTQRATCTGTVAVTLPDFGGSMIGSTPLLLDFNADRAFTITSTTNRSFSFGGSGLRTTLTLDTLQATFVKPKQYSISGQGAFAIKGWSNAGGGAGADRVFKVNSFSIVRTPDKTEPQIRINMTAPGPVAIVDDVIQLDSVSAKFATDDQGAKLLTFSDANARIGNLAADELKGFAIRIRGIGGVIRLDGSAPKLDFSKVSSIDVASGTLLGREILGNCTKELGSDGKLPPLFDQKLDTNGRPAYEMCVGTRVMEPGSVIGARDQVNADLRLSFNDAKKRYDVERAELSMPPKAKPFIVRLASRTMSVSDIDVEYSRDRPSLLPQNPDGTRGLPLWVATDGTCDPYLRGSMTISADAVLSSSKPSSLTPEVFLGKSCMFGSADGLVYLEMGTNASATLRSIKFAVTPMKVDATKTMVHVEAAGDLYIQSAVLSFNALGLHYGPKGLQTLHAINVPTTVQNNVVRNFSALAGLLGGLIGKIILK